MDDDWLDEWDETPPGSGIYVQNALGSKRLAEYMLTHKDKIEKMKAEIVAEAKRLEEARLLEIEAESKKTAIDYSLILDRVVCAWFGLPRRSV